MTFAPKTIEDFAAYWVAQGGVNSGIVGNNVHCNGYHLGKDRIYGDCACKPTGKCVPGKRGNDYSVVDPRDKAGLTNAASAIDLGRLDKSLPKLWKFSEWLVAQVRANQPGTRDIKEIIFSPDGKRVFGFVRSRGLQSKLIPDYGDRSHLWHTHISFYRDSEFRDKVGIISPYFEGEAVESFDTPEVPTQGTVAKGAKLYKTSTLTGAAIVVDPARPMPYYGQPTKGVAMVQRTAEDGTPTGTMMFLKRTGISDVKPIPVTGDDTPFSQADIEAARNDGRAEGVTEGTEQEQERMRTLLGL